MDFNKFVPSPQQQAILDYLIEHINDDNRVALAISALAGTGKTTTILWVIHELEKLGHEIKGAYCAFNSSIVKEVEPKLAGTNIQPKTFHSLGSYTLHKHCEKEYGTQFPKKFWDKVNTNKYKELINSYIDADDDIAIMIDDAARYSDDANPYDVRKALVDNADKLCHYIRVRLEPWNDSNRLNWLIRDYGLSHELLSDELLDVMMDMQPVILKQGEELLTRAGIMDFDDMIYWVCHWDVPLKYTNQWIFLDEAQDLSPMQRKIVSKALKYNGRIVIVGDPNQSIYRFTGADSDSFDRTVKWFKADILPLSVTRRCSKIVAHHCRTLVPDFKALDTAERGKFIWLDQSKFADHVKPGDMVICRVNAGLVGAAIELLAKEIPVVILGGDIGPALIGIMETIVKRDGFRWSKAQEAVDSYRFTKVNYLRSKDDEEAARTVQDNCEAIKILLENSKAMTMASFTEYVENLFADKDGQGKVILCTAHKSKGLEADRVFILQPEKMPFVYPGMHPESYQQEKHLFYVAMSRAQKDLIFLTNPDFLKPYLADKSLIPTYVQYDFADHRWTEDGLYMLDENDLMCIQLPSGSLKFTVPPEMEKEVNDMLDKNTIPAGTLVSFTEDEQTGMRFIQTHEEVGEIEKAIEENPLSAEEADAIGFAASSPYVEVAVAGDDPVENGSVSIPEQSPVDEKPEALIFPDEPVAWAKFVLEHKDRIVVLDTETNTWSSDAQCEVVQLGITDLDGKTLFNQKIKPHGLPVTDGAAGIHGITNEMLASEKHLEDYLPYIRDAIQDKYIIAYNAPFDEKAMEHAFRNAGIEAVPVAGWQCAMVQYTRHNPNKLYQKGKVKGKSGAKWKLVEAVEQQRMTAREDAHDALADVLMTVDLIKSMAKDSEHRWKNKVGYIKDDIVEVKASKARMIILKPMPNGDLNMRDPKDDSRQTMSEGMIHLVTRAEDVPTLPAYMQPEPDSLEAVAEIASTENELEETIVEVVSEKTQFQEGDKVITRTKRKGIVKSHKDRFVQVDDGIRVAPHKAEDLKYDTEGAPEREYLENHRMLKPGDSVTADENDRYYYLHKAEANTIRTSEPVKVTPVPVAPAKTTHNELERIITKFGSRADALEFITLLEEVIDNVYPV